MEDSFSVIVASLKPPCHNFQRRPQATCRYQSESYVQSLPSYPNLDIIPPPIDPTCISLIAMLICSHLSAFCAALFLSSTIISNHSLVAKVHSYWHAVEISKSMYFSAVRICQSEATLLSSTEELPSKPTSIRPSSLDQAT